MVAKPKTNANHACPICNSPADQDTPTFPFCCDRCRKIDLGKWFDGKYMISRPIEQSDIEEGE